MKSSETTTLEGIRADCWCGASSFREFGPDYLECLTCGTLVSQKGLSGDSLLVVDDESDFYGKKYWLDHVSDELDQPDIIERTRADLPERNLYWLRTLLKYRLPPARVMELGCAHGSFVALMHQCGFQASGVEMSPWVVELGKKTFGIDVQLGPVESLAIEPDSVDVIAMMDVMEHLPDPVATMSHCLSLLKPDGILLIQMPDFQEGMRYENLVETESSFLEQLKEDEHLYLYSKRATVEFFHRLGADHIAFEPAIFAHYDMCFVVSRAPLQVNEQAQIDASLLATPQGRIGLALLDMKDRYDRAPILEQEIAPLHRQLQDLYVRADAVSNERNLAQAQLADLQGHFEAAERDRAARGKVIQDQGARISELEGQIHLRLQELNDIYARMQAGAGVAPALAAASSPISEESSDTQERIAFIERDRAERLAVIQAQGQRIAELEGEVHRRLQELNDLYPALESERVRAADFEQRLASASSDISRIHEDLQQYSSEARRKDAELEALRQRWWWKLGSFFKAI
jgi:2-polyprenyl-3-methyl-5-hydroxy-6-metoxy-1,4-benzoquinol methylase